MLLAPWHNLLILYCMFAKKSHFSSLFDIILTLSSGLKLIGNIINSNHENKLSLKHVNSTLWCILQSPESPFPWIWFMKATHKFSCMLFNTSHALDYTIKLEKKILGIVWWKEFLGHSFPHLLQIINPLSLSFSHSLKTHQVIACPWSLITTYLAFLWLGNSFHPLNCSTQVAQFKNSSGCIEPLDSGTSTFNPQS